jgi:tRNA (cytidine/uridine-2'-O-)-methyltransferase
VRLHLWPDFLTLEAKLPTLGQPYFFSGQAERLYHEIRYPDETVLIFGRESVGLPSSLLERYRDRMVRIPMIDPALRSLNLSTSAGIAMFEVIRQRSTGKADPG